ncbi:type II secretion system protein E (GspE) [Magnetococcus marinus MC-1]|uniref:Type II secretion system protein E (GspE) n=1 Tax=Magnetococcus marinus (strain ATCC BAA-1437 / JCM 17883 / MC-1) TaxID=156889 RepID=A0L656_MAGMM|nr:GspE/PulE family protein [Magnetococcus marinus]ABK43449.1 type II secretion system protein E (GspE) [Magnetococcus marinus MC-1]
MNDQPRKKPIGVLLQEKGLISDAHIGLALQDQKITKERVGEILERLGFVSQYDVATTISEQEDRPYLDINAVRPAEESLRLFNRNICEQNDFLPMRHDTQAGAIECVTAADDVVALDKLITRHTGLKPFFYQGEKGKIRNAVQYYYYFLENPVEKLLEREIQLLSMDKDDVRNLDNFVAHLFQLAVKNRASDIHIRPMDRAINIAFRIDGVLRPMFSLPPSMKRVITTLKMRADMDIAEQRLPQDGSFGETILTNHYDFRVSTTVCPYGENMVMRLLPAKSDFMGLPQLGFEPDDIELVRQIFNEPYGIVLLTGPTGSGKTTTLYAAVRALNLTEKNVMTVENPIEYRIPLMRQTQINTKAGYTFSSAIRHFLRHDPDVILVGEIRDKETAETAISASETGHLVLSTLHTNTAFGALPRLRSLGIPPFMLADSLVGVVSQRLVRKICPTCKEAYTPSQEELDYLKIEGLDTLYRGVGCETCFGTGFHGRTLVYEVLRSFPALAVAIGNDATLDEMRHIAVSNGYREIETCAHAKLVRGDVSLSEVVRVLGY